MKRSLELRRLFLLVIVCFLELKNLQLVQAVNILSNITSGETLSFDEQVYVKYNDQNLLMLASTLTCPHGKRIAGQWAKCFECPTDSVYDNATVSCVCSNSNQYFNWQTLSCNLKPDALPSDADKTNCSAPIAFMDSWNNCSSLSEFETVCLVDSRDYRTYKVRKFADGHCWMVDSLKFGGVYGETDGCSANSGEGNYTYAWCGGSGVSGCTAGGAVNATKALDTFTNNYYGHCRQNTIDNTYLYDFVAAIQSTLGYQGSSTLFAGVQQGVCPANWHLPLGGSSGDYRGLANKYGSSMSGFWTNEDKWHGYCSGYAHNTNGSLNDQGTYGNFWSSTVVSVNHVYALGYQCGGSSFSPEAEYWKSYGRTVRCVRD
ncbi:hypothetical protein IJJ27_04135 [bacterium]|nr:hypothetical protein [bacterium]MBQ6436714.1 hypothetical protein [bacterium]